MPTIEERLFAIEALLTTTPSNDWPVALLEFVADKSRAATAVLEMTFGPWEVQVLSGPDGQVNVSRTPLKRSGSNYPFFHFRAVDSVYGSGFHCFSLHHKCSREEFVAMIPTIQMVCDAAWSLMGARMLDEVE